MLSKFIDSNLQTLLNAQNQIYRAPSEALSRYIAKYTFSFASDNIAPDTIALVPDGSGCLIFTYDGSSLTSLLWGAATKTFVVKNDMNDYPMQLFIELLPGCLFYLTGLKQTGLTNLQIPLSQIDNHLHLLVSNAFENANNLNDFIDRLNFILLSYMQNRSLPYGLKSALEKIKLYNGCLSVKELADTTFYSDRHLNRLFNDYIGINAKTFSSIIRINHVLQKINDKNRLPQGIAQTSGFYDQAHFIHTFKSICGETPKRFLENMSEFYNESFKF
jgi:AraC-like DNA-binding protein